MARPSYTVEQIGFLRAFRLFPLDVITGAFNAHFGTDKAVASMQAAYKNHRIQRVRQSPGKGNGTPRVYTPERVAWLRDFYPVMKIAELTAAFNSRFGTTIGKVAIHGALGRFGIQSGRDGLFEQGQKPWNAGTKGQGLTGPNSGTFKKGNVPANHKPLWSERVGKDGYIEMSVPERNPHTGFSTRYMHKHVWLWKQAHGPVPKGHCVIFENCDKYDFSPENLILVSRNDLLLLNLHKYKDALPEIRPAIMALARMEAKAGFRSTGRHPDAGRKKKSLIKDASP